MQNQSQYVFAYESVCVCAYVCLYVYVCISVCVCFAALLLLFSVELAILLTFCRFVFINTFYSARSLSFSPSLPLFALSLSLLLLSQLAINTNLQHFRMFTRDFS